MDEFQCLYLEDDNDDFETFKQTFERAMKPTRLLIERAKTTTEAFEKLDVRGGQLHILFADLLMPNDSMEGLNVVDYVSGTFPKILIIGISKAEGSHPGTLDDFKKRAGPVSWFFDKRLLKGVYTYERIRSEIVAVAAQKGYVLSDEAACEIDWKAGVAGNEKLDAEIDSIGIDRLAKILKLIAPESITFTPYYLTPGLSRASVLRVRGRAEGTPPRNLLVKLSTDRRKLEEELAAAPKEGEPSSHVYVPYLSSTEPWYYDGIFAIAGRFEEDAITLERWLIRPEISPADTVQDVFDELFVHGLNRAYVNGRSVAGTTPMALLAPNIRTRARILISLESTHVLLQQITTSLDLNIVQNFVRHNGQINSHSPTVYPLETYICLSHGDLHSRNILIDPVARSRPKLIDTAKRGERHWASDPARLCADLWMTVWDRNPDSYFWEKLEAWREQIRRWRKGENINIDAMSPNRRVWDALSWMSHKLGTLFDLAKPECAKWQFDLALALEFLTMSAYCDVPMPKRCLAVLAATDILTELDSTIPWL
jgi:hypothetical protein